MMRGQYLYILTDNGPRVWHVQELLGNGIIAATGVKSLKTMLIDVAEALYGPNQVCTTAAEMIDFLNEGDEAHIESAAIVEGYAAGRKACRMAVEGVGA